MNSSKWRYDTQHNGIHHNNTQHNDIEHKNKKRDNQHNDIRTAKPIVAYAECRKQARNAKCRYAECRYTECRGALLSDKIQLLLY